MSKDSRTEADAATCAAQTSDLKQTATALETVADAKGKLSPEQQAAAATAKKFINEQEADMRKSGSVTNDPMLAAMNETNNALAAALKNGNFNPDKAMASGLKYMAEEVRGAADVVDQACRNNLRDQRMREERSGGRS